MHTSILSDAELAKSTVEKYYGAVEWSAVDKMFTLTVMMQNQRRPENEL